jgi:hypothetical protein
MPFTHSCLVGGFEKKQYLEEFSINGSFGARWSADFTFKCKSDDVFGPAIGQPIDFSAMGVTLFTGTVNSVTRTVAYGADGVYALTTASAVTDYTHALDRRMTDQRTWTNLPSGTIVQDIANTYLTDEDIGLTYVATGTNVESFSVDYATVSQALDSLKAITGYVWRVTFDKELRWHDKAGYTSSVVINSSNISELSVRESREEYANVVHVRVGNYITDEQTESMNGNGSTRTFELTYGIASTPTVTVNSVIQTVDIIGGTAQWYWQVGSNTLTQDSGQTVLTGGDTLEVVYIGQDSRVITVQDDDEIAARQLLEGTSGRYEYITESQTPSTQGESEALANAILSDRAALSEEITATTNTFLEPSCLSLSLGERLWFDVAAADAVGHYLITGLRFANLSNIGIQVDITAASGPMLQDAIRFFKELRGGTIITSSTQSGGSGGSDGTITHDGGEPY